MSQELVTRYKNITSYDPKSENCAVSFAQQVNTAEIYSMTEQLPENNL